MTVFSDGYSESLIPERKLWPLTFLRKRLRNCQNGNTRKPEKPPEPGPRPETEARKAENLENLRNGITVQKNKKKMSGKVTAAVCTYYDNWEDARLTNPDMLKHLTKWKGQTEFEGSDGTWTIHDHSHKWTSLLRTPDHFPRAKIDRAQTFTGGRRTTLFAVQTKQRIQPWHVLFRGQIANYRE